MSSSKHSRPYLRTEWLETLNDGKLSDLPLIVQDHDSAETLYLESQKVRDVLRPWILSGLSLLAEVLPHNVTLFLTRTVGHVVVDIRGSVLQDNANEHTAPFSFVYDIPEYVYQQALEVSKKDREQEHEAWWGRFLKYLLFNSHHTLSVNNGTYEKYLKIHPPEVINALEQCMQDLWPGLTNSVSTNS